MTKLPSRVLLLLISFSLTASIARAQCLVHATSGTVTAIHPKIQMTSAATDDGTPGAFEWLSKVGGTANFDKSVSVDATPVEKFTAMGAQTIVYYCGIGNVRTIVALRDLGTTPLIKTLGIVLKFDRKARQLTIMNLSAATEIFQLDAKTVGDTSEGVASNFKYDYIKNEQVRVLATQSNGVENAILITPAY